MHCYIYDKQTKQYQGAKKRQLDPIEKRYLMPANGTLIEPPLYDREKETIFFISGEWEIREFIGYQKKILKKKDENGIAFYKISKGKVVKKTKAEMEPDILKAKQFKIKQQAASDLREYREELLIRVLNLLNMTTELAHIDALNQIINNDSIDIEPVEIPTKTE